MWGSLIRLRTRTLVFILLAPALYILVLLACPTCEIRPGIAAELRRSDDGAAKPTVPQYEQSGVEYTTSECAYPAGLDSLKSKRAYAILAVGEDYVAAALVLVHRLQQLNVRYPMVLLMSTNATEGQVAKILNAGASVHHTDLQAPPHVNARVPKWQQTYQKLGMWSLVNFERVISLDCDVYVETNPDELFDMPGVVLAKQDYNVCSRVPNRFASAVMALSPSERAFGGMMDILNDRNRTLDGGDQDIINAYFPLGVSAVALPHNWVVWDILCEMCAPPDHSITDKPVYFQVMFDKPFDENFNNHECDNISSTSCYYRSRCMWKSTRDSIVPNKKVCRPETVHV